MIAHATRLRGDAAGRDPEPRVTEFAGAAPADVVRERAATYDRTARTLSTEESAIPRTIALLGGPQLLRQKLSTRAEIHAALVGGIPYAVLFFLTAHVDSLTEDDVAQVLRTTPRTLRRHRDTPQKAMPVDLGSQTWLLAETLAKAEDLFGGRDAAERWMTKEAMGLDRERPIDMLRTPPGTSLVNQFLERLKYGVYN